MGGVSLRSWPRPPSVPSLTQCRPTGGPAPSWGPAPSDSERPTNWLPLVRRGLQGSIYVNDFARVVSSDQEAVNGVLHFIDRVLLPPDVLHWEPDAAPALRV